MNTPNRPNDERSILNLLTRQFEGVEKEFLEGEIKRFQDYAKGNLNGWLERVKSGPVQGSYGNWRLNYPPQYVKHVDGIVGAISLLLPQDEQWKVEASAKINRGHDSTRFEAYRIISEHNGWLADLEAAKLDAERSVAVAKDHFLYKQTNKVLMAIQKRPDSIHILTARLEYLSGYIAGILTVTFANGDGFVVDLDMITNHRYRPQFKAYYQYPTRFKAIKHGGKERKKVSLAWMAENFS